MRKKLLICFLLLISFTGVLSACGKKSDNSDDTKKLIKITIYADSTDYSGMQTGWSAVLFKEKFGVELEFVAGSDTTFQAGLEKGSLGDIVILDNKNGNYSSALSQQLLYDWDKNNLIGEKGGYIVENMSKEIQSNRDISGGKLYGIAAQSGVTTEEKVLSDFVYTWDIRWDLYKKLDYPEINTLNDLYLTLMEMKQNCPKDDNGNSTYGLSLWADKDSGMAIYINELAAAYYGLEADGVMGHYDIGKNEYFGSLEEDSPYLQILTWLNKLYRAGLIDPDSQYQTYNQMLQKAAAGSTLFSLFSYSGSEVYNTDAHLKQGKMMASMCPTEARTPLRETDISDTEYIFSIGAGTQYPELCMEIINWLCSPAGAMTVWYGPKGLTWNYDEQGYTYLTELGELISSDSNYDLSQVALEINGEKVQLSGSFAQGCLQTNCTILNKKGINPDSLQGESFAKEDWLSQIEKKRTGIQKDWMEKTGYQNAQDYLKGTNYVLIPTIKDYETPELSEGFENKLSKVTECIIQQSWKAIFSASEFEFDYVVKQMIKQANMLGYDECLDFCRQTAAAKYGAQNNK